MTGNRLDTSTADTFAVLLSVLVGRASASAAAVAPHSITSRHISTATNHATDPHTQATINSVPPVNEDTPVRSHPPGAPTMTVRDTISMLAPLWSVGKRGRG